MLSLQICLTSRFLYLWILVMVNIWLRLTKRAAHAVFYLMLYGAYWTFNFFFFRTVDEVQAVDEVGDHLNSDVRFMNVMVFFF